MIRVTYVINGLQVGGAETMLVRLVRTLDATRFTATVIALTDDEPLGAVLTERGVEVVALGMQRGRVMPQDVARLGRAIRRSSPDMVHTWMYHADLLGGLTARVLRLQPVIWSLRQSDLDPRESPRHTIWTARVCARLSTLVPFRILAVSESVARHHVALGYSDERIHVIPNGFDLNEFHPDADARARARAALGLAVDAPVVGAVGRFDPQKDHESLLDAACEVVARLPKARFVLIGRELDSSNQRIADSVRRRGLDEACVLLGERDDVSALVPAFDVAVSSSAFGEGFPNAIGEAMACGVPCVVTDVGDSAALVGDTGRVVPRRRPRALAGALYELLSLDEADRRTLGRAAPDRVVRDFSLPAIAGRYERFYEAVDDVWHRRAR